jgi:hypothetical protein
MLGLATIVVALRSDPPAGGTAPTISLTADSYAILRRALTHGGAGEIGNLVDARGDPFRQDGIQPKSVDLTGGDATALDTLVGRFNTQRGIRNEETSSLIRKYSLADHIEDCRSAGEELG